MKLEIKVDNLIQKCKRLLYELESRRERERDYRKLPKIKAILGLILHKPDSLISNTPPKTAEYLIYLLIPRKNREVMLGDMEEDFYIVCEKFGPLKAKFHYWFQVLRSIPSLIGASVIKMVVTSITNAFKTSN